LIKTKPEPYTASKRPSAKKTTPRIKRITLFKSKPTTSYQMFAGSFL
jgi:hypothetical protein